MRLWMMMLLALSARVTLSRQNRESNPGLMVGRLQRFLQELKKEYFSDCTILIFYDPIITSVGEKVDVFSQNKTLNGDLNNYTYDEDILKFVLKGLEGSTHMVFSLSGDLQDVLTGTNLNTASLCPLYLTLVPQITSILSLFLMANKDWDKYFLSRKHVIITHSPMKDIEEVFQQGEINYMTNVLIIHSLPKNSAFRLVTNTPYNTRGTDNLKTLATWRGEALKQTHDLFPDKLRNLHGYLMRVVTFHFPPRIFMEEMSDGEYNLYGVDIDVVRALSSALNFSVSFVRPSDGEMWGWEQSNGTWTGLMGDLQHRRADIGVADLYIMEQYFAIIDMSVAYDIEYLCFVNMIPGPLPQWMALGLPFLLETWLAIFCTVLGGMVVFTILGKLCLVEETDPNETRWFRRGSNICLLLIACVMNTSWTRVPTASHLRIFISLWTLAFLILAVAYRGSLVSYLTVPLEQPPIDTHKQLLAKNVPVGSIGYTLKRVMEKNADQYVRKLAEIYEHVPSTDVGLQRTVAGTYSFLESRGFLDYTIAVDYTNNRGRASLHAMKEYIAPFGIGLAYPKYVPFIDKFNRVIRRLTEAGLAKKYMSDIILRSKQAKMGKVLESKEGPSDPNNGETESGVTALTIDNLQGGFMLLAIGYGLGLLAFAFELMAIGLRKCK